MHLALLLLLAACTPETTVADTDASSGLTWRQIGLRGPSLGEAALLTAGGVSVLVDVGNDAHSDAIVDAVEAAGLGNSVDWVVLTHHHADHIGGVDKVFGEGGPLQVRQGIIWRGGVNGAEANDSEVDGVTRVTETAPAIPLCDGTACPALPFTIALGDATLTVFLANGLLATRDGTIDLLDGSEDENARSLGAVVSYGDFDLVFAGDLTGGGKDTPDIEGAVAARRDAIPWVHPHGVDVIQLNHHGISSSTSSAWVQWLLGAGDANAIVGANAGYLDAPSEEAQEALIPWLGQGAIWVTRTGLLGGGDRIEAGGDVVVEVDAQGRYTVRTEGTREEERTFLASPSPQGLGSR